MANTASSSRNPIVGALLRWMGGLRYPQLFVLFAVLFGLDFVLPDPIPFLDELLFGLGMLLLGSLRRRRDDRPIDVTPPRR